MLVWKNSAGDPTISTISSRFTTHRLSLYRLVLFLLLAPILLVGVVAWFLLPGSIGGIHYRPSVFTQQAALQPSYWQHHSATVVGYDAGGRCMVPLPCPGFFLADAPGGGAGSSATRLWVASQRESGWHALLHKLFPGQVTAPLPQGLHTGQQIRVSGRMQTILNGGKIMVLLPNDL
jgi:hypothetical protein